MNIEFMFNDIKNINLIYNSEKKYNELWGSDVTTTNYLGTDYCNNIVEQIKNNFVEIKKINYNGQKMRIAHEEYDIETLEEKYKLSFTIDTFEEKKQTQLIINLSSTSDGKYDSVLEKLKVFIKEILLKDWEMCTWIIDEQSEYLGMGLYPLIFKTENKMRAFINKVLTYKFGVKWINELGLEGIKKAYRKSNIDFKREVPDFNNINDFLISLTIESLVKLMLESKVFETSFTLADMDKIRLHEMLSDGNSNSVFQKLIESRKVKVDIWEELFKKYFDNDIKKSITDFIKNRNHVAHNKLITKAAFDKMKRNILEVQSRFDIANEKFIKEAPSNELYETWDLEQQEIQDEKEYILERIENEAGIKILSEREIFKLFEKKIEEIYTSIDDSEYFSYTVVISKFNNVQEESVKKIIFSVESKVDSSFNFNVCALFDITEGMGEDSYLDIWIETSDMTKLLETRIKYHNGEAYEDTMECYYIPESESYFENERLNDFISNLKNYIREDMNTIKSDVDSSRYSIIKDGGNLPVADFPCWNCNENYISINNDLYNYGYCINCGEKN
ncbi:hypothetical protein ACQPUZ_08505 [Clostridium tertium]